MILIGIIIGILISILVVATLTFFRRILEKQITIIEKQVDLKAPKPKGYIIEPEDEIDEARANIIAKNKSSGRDTNIDDLRI